MARNPDTMLTGDTREAWGQWRRRLRAANRAETTIRNYGEAVCALQEWLNASRDGRAAIDATAGDVEDFLGHVLALRTSGTAASRYRCLRQFWKFLAAEDLADDVMARVKGPVAKSKVPEVLTDDELRRLLAACRPAKGAKQTATELRDETMIRIFLEPGSPRCAEMAALTLDDIDLDAETITIRHGKGDRLRVIPMSPETQAVMFRYKRARRASTQAAAFISFAGETAGMALTVSGIEQMLRRRGARAGLPGVHPHQLRHTSFADFDAASGGHTNAEMALYGWSSPQMAYHYGKSARARHAVSMARQMNRSARLAAR